MSLFEIHYSPMDFRFVVMTHAGHIYRTCKTFGDAMAICGDADATPEAWDEFIAWQRKSSRRIVMFTLQRLRWKRQQEEEWHGPQIPPFEEF